VKRPVLLHPVVLAAIAILAMNDHVWKRAAPGLVTGKLSDVAGLLFFPAMLAAVWGLAREGQAAAGNAVKVLLVASIATVLVFALVKTWLPANLAYRWGLGALQWPFIALRHVAAGAPVRSVAPVSLVMDVTDLAALPFALATLALRKLVPSSAE
jgi:hypothetical protein